MIFIENVEIHSSSKGMLQHIPNILSLSRIPAVIPIILFLRSGFQIIAAWVFFAAVFTDIIDGLLARKLGVDNALGARIDVISDFVLLISLCIFFHYEGMMSLPPIILLSISFFQFILGSVRNRPVYDLLGKYTGSLGFIMILIFILFPNQTVGIICSKIFIFYILISLGIRFMYFRKLILKSSVYTDEGGK